MAEDTIIATPTQSEYIAERERTSLSPLWQRLLLGGVILVSLFMDFFQLGMSSFGNLFYASGVRSMLDNWHNFFFASYDPGGFVTIDKPALGFWLQTISAKIFGFTPFSIYFPQALAGVCSVIVLYLLVKRHFGVVAGLLAALALAISPISVVTNRNNTIDSTLALALLLGAWAVLKAAETGRLRWLLLSSVFVGLGFNIKMAEALLVLPAFVVLYLLAAPRTIWTRIWHTAVAMLLLLVISASWIVTVDLIPASQRPYVGSTQDNSEISLATGYNGINRLIGGRGIRIGNTPGGGGANTRTGNTTRTGNGSTSNTTTTPQNGNGNGQAPTAGNPPTANPPTANPARGGANGRGGAGGIGGAGGFGGFGGRSNPLQLFTNALGSQIGWLLPFALAGLLALAWQRRWRFTEDRQQKSLLLWGVWVLAMGAYFSLASIAHEYYLTEMAPGVAALFGIGTVVMWQDYRRPGLRGWLLPLALIITAAVQISILNSYPAWAQWMVPVIGGLCALAALVLLAVRLFPRLRMEGRSARYLMPALCAGILAVLIAPTVWSTISVIQNNESSSPTAGPTPSRNAGGAGGAAFAAAFAAFGDNATTDPMLIKYLEANQGNTKFLVAVSSSMMADGIIMATNKPVMAMGGFSGGDPILTTSKLAQLISNGTVRFFMTNGVRTGAGGNDLNNVPEQFRDFVRGGGGFGGFGGFGGGTQNTLTTWITQHCKQVPKNFWSTLQSNTGSTQGNTGQLYDCAGAH